MDKTEKAAFVETIPAVRDAPEEVLIRYGSRRGKTSKTAQGSKAYERKYYMRSDYLRFDDGLVARLEAPSIEDTIWYDDEYDDPLGGNDRKSAWITCNMWDAFGRWDRETEDFVLHHRYDSKNADSWWGTIVHPDGSWHFAEGRRPYLFDAYTKSRSYLEMNIHPSRTVDYSAYKVRDLTDEELDAWFEIREQRKADFRDRLEKYWKRYSHKVHSRGYWANR